jgi:hypothetical protein
MAGRRQPDAAWWASSWNGRALREILRDRDISTLFQFLRSRGLSRSTIASLAGLAEHRVTAIAQGRQQVEAYAVLERICEGFSIPRQMMGLGLADSGTNDLAIGTARVAICGSRGVGTDGKSVDFAVLALGQVFEDTPWLVQHGPRGVGIEVLTHIANNRRPEGLHQVVGILGHANVVRGVAAVIVVGGGKGTNDEVDAAFEAGRRLIPLASTGGAAQRTHRRMARDPSLRAWIADADFTLLGGEMDTATMANMIERLVSECRRAATHG